MLHALRIGVVLYLGWSFATILLILGIFLLWMRRFGPGRAPRPSDPQRFTTAAGDEY